MALTFGVTETGRWGNDIDGRTDEDGVVRAAFEADGGEDMLLVFQAYDVDTAGEIEVRLNGEAIGAARPGPVNGFAQEAFVLGADLLQEGTNWLQFVQTEDETYTWGVADVLLTEVPDEAPVALALDGPEAGPFGNGFDALYDSDGRLDVTFDSAGADLRLRFDGYDIDTMGDVDVLLNGTLLGSLGAGMGDAWTRYELLLDDADLAAGTNTLSFVSNDPVWGIDMLRLDEAPPRFTPTDDRYAEQWQLRAIGNFEEVWADYTGAGVTVAVYDDGLQFTHPDLDGNYDAGLHVTVGGQVLDPSTGASSHGTAVAGILAAEADGTGIVGAAFDATIAGVNIIDGIAGAGAPDLGDYYEAILQMAGFDVVNNSWGAVPGFEPDDPPPGDLFGKTLAAFQTAAETGRDGLGTILVKSAGNSSANSSGDLADASRHSITVAASDIDGAAAFYSNHGANVLVSTPSSGLPFFSPGVLTTDLVGAPGYTPGNYTGTDALTGFGGTSAAAPLLSGVAALMLEANPGLGWRDVQNILALSATFSGGQEMESWVLPFLGGAGFEWVTNGAQNWNGGGMHFSPDFGFGIVDVNDAVRMAEVWHLFGPARTSASEESHVESATAPLALGTGVSVEFDLADVALSVEHVLVSVTLSDSTVDIILTSAEGTRVQLYASGDAPAGPLDWSFGAEAFLGETAAGAGAWTLEIVDPDAGGAVLEDYTVEWYGQADDPVTAADDTYHYTDEMFSAVVPAEGDAADAPVDDPERTRLEDADGGTDWLNMAAMSDDLTIDLARGASSLAGTATFLTLAETGTIENAVAGDGDDQLSGNAAANTLLGMRGDDVLIGGAGDDWLSGGRGRDTFVIHAGDGEDWIEDFDVASDTLALVGLAADFESLSFGLTTGGDARLSFATGEAVDFNDVEVSALTPSNFAFYDTAFA
jgi:subtilisin family serine protease